MTRSSRSCGDTGRPSSSGSTRRGPAAARNAGVAGKPSTDVVLFTDDDCVPAPGWAATLAASGRSGTGPHGRRRAHGAELPQRVRRRLADDRAARVEHTTRLLRDVATSRCPRTTLLEIPFDVPFAEASGEDRDWCARVLACRGPGLRASLVRRAALPDSTRASASSVSHARYGRASTSAPASAGREPTARGSSHPRRFRPGRRRRCARRPGSGRNARRLPLVLTGRAPSRPPLA